MTKAIDVAGMDQFLIILLRDRMRSNSHPQAQEAFDALTATEQDELILTMFHNKLSARANKLLDRKRRKTATKVEKQSKKEAKKTGKSAKAAKKTAKAKPVSKPVVQAKVPKAPVVETSTPEALKSRVEKLLAARTVAKRK
jgi:hypothetical protein